MLKYLIRYKYSLFLVLIISLLSLLPDRSMPDTQLVDIPYLDKIIHFCMWGSLGFTALLEMRCRKACRKRALRILFTLFLLSLFIEVLQTYFIDSRSGEWADLAANFLGLSGAAFLYYLISVFRS